MNSKMIGGILMILGTSIGAGMLALPLASAQEGFCFGAVMLILCWAAMTVGAFLLLEVALWCPPESNLISMAKITLGREGQLIAWVAYLLLLYALLCAYIAGSSDVLHSVLHQAHLATPHWLDASIAVLIIALIVYRGIFAVDIVNRFLMSAKFCIYALLVITIAPHIQLPLLKEGSVTFKLSTMMVMITSFGYAIIIPSLISYFHRDLKQLKRVIFAGSLIPLLIYLLWMLVIQGLIPRYSVHGLIAIASSEHAVSHLMQSAAIFINKPLIANIANLFISICVVTSFLGVSLCLTDFIADGLHINKKNIKKNWIIYLVSFLPPLLIVILWPGLFIKALSYAGICCIVILILLPILMTLGGRYRKKIKAPYRTCLNGSLLFLLLILSVGLFVTQIVQFFR